MYEMRTEDLGFLEDAPVVHVFEADLAAPRKAVFELLTDTASWSRWFPGFRRGEYGESEMRVGTPRNVEIGPGVRFEEHIVAWDEPRRYTWVVDRASVPMAHALVESWDFSELDLPGAPGGGTRAKWTFAVDPKWPMRVVTPLAPLVMGALFRAAMRRLERIAAGGH